MKQFMKGFMAFLLALGMWASAPVFATAAEGHPTSTVITKPLLLTQQSSARVMTVKTTQDQQRKEIAGKDCPPCNEDPGPRVPQVMGTW